MQVNELWNWVHLMVKYLAHTTSTLKSYQNRMSERSKHGRAGAIANIMSVCFVNSTRTRARAHANTKKKNWRKTTNKWVLLCKCSAKVDVNDAICWTLLFSIFVDSFYTYIHIYFFFSPFCFCSSARPFCAPSNKIKHTKRRENEFNAFVESTSSYWHRVNVLVTVDGIYIELGTRAQTLYISEAVNVFRSVFLLCLAIVVKRKKNFIFIRICVHLPFSILCVQFLPFFDA